MKIIDFNMKYYATIYRTLKDLGLTEIDISNTESRVLVDNDKIIGFFSAEKIKGYYNLHHLFISKDYRGTRYVWMLLNDLISEARKKGCRYIVIHVIRNSRLEIFAKVYCKHRKLGIKSMNIEYKDFNFYKVEV